MSDDTEQVELCEMKIDELQEINKVLLNACHAALSQLTEDRPEYLAQDIQQLRDAIAKAGHK